MSPSVKIAIFFCPYTKVLYLCNNLKLNALDDKSPMLTPDILGPHQI